QPAVERAVGIGEAVPGDGQPVEGSGQEHEGAGVVGGGKKNSGGGSGSGVPSGRGAAARTRGAVGWGPEHAGLRGVAAVSVAGRSARWLAWSRPYFLRKRCKAMRATATPPVRREKTGGAR